MCGRTNYTYNAANQLVSDGVNTLTYDNNGNMTSDGVNSYTWDRANRLLTWDNGVASDLVNHAYDGEGRRVSQAIGTTSPTITKYLLDIQPGLSVVLSQTEGSDVTRFVHAPRGIHARQDASNDWHWTVQDGLGTVRVETDNSVAVEGSQNLDPFGNLIDMVNGAIDTPYGFTGELVDGSGLLDLRARRYNAGIGVFTGLDPFEGMRDRAMSLNGYSWVEGNVPNVVDPSGMISSSLGNSLNIALALSSSMCLASFNNVLQNCVFCGGALEFLCGGVCNSNQTTQPTPVPFVTNTPQSPAPFVTNTPQPPAPFVTNTPQPPTPTPVGADLIRGLAQWELQMLALVSLIEAENSPSQWEAIDYAFFNRLTDTQTWSNCASPTLPCILQGSSGWASPFLASFGIAPLNVNQQSASNIWANNVYSPTKRTNALAQATLTSQTYGSKPQYLGLYYFRNKISDDVAQLQVRQMKCITDSGNMDAATQQSLSLRRALKTAIVPEESADGALVLNNVFSTAPNPQGSCSNPK